MMTPDVNVLLAASRSDHPHYPQAIAWLNQAIDGCTTGSSLQILPMVASGFLRLATHPKVFIKPTPVDKAIAFMDALLTIPGVEMVQDIGREWALLCRLCQTGKLSGNAIPDAWIAAAVKICGAHLITFDRDFIKLLDKRDLTLLIPD